MLHAAVCSSGSGNGSSSSSSSSSKLGGVGLHSKPPAFAGGDLNTHAELSAWRS